MEKASTNVQTCKSHTTHLAVCICCLLSVRCFDCRAFLQSGGWAERRRGYWFLAARPPHGQQRAPLNSERDARAPLRSLLSPHTLLSLCSQHAGELGAARKKAPLRAPWVLTFRHPRPVIAAIRSVCRRIIYICFTDFWLGRTLFISFNTLAALRCTAKVKLCSFVCAQEPQKVLFASLIRKFPGRSTNNINYSQSKPFLFTAATFWGHFLLYFCTKQTSIVYKSSLTESRLQQNFSSYARSLRNFVWVSGKWFTLSHMREDSPSPDYTGGLKW